MSSGIPWPTVDALAPLWATYHRRRSVASRNAIVAACWPSTAKFAMAFAWRRPSLEAAAVKGAAAVGLIAAVERWEPDRGAFRGFALMLARQRMVDASRAEGRFGRPWRDGTVPGRATLSLEYEAVGGAGRWIWPEAPPPDTAGRPSLEDREAAGRILAAVCPEERLYLELHFFSGLRPTEIARMTGVHPNRVYARIRHALDVGRRLARAERW